MMNRLSAILLLFWCFQGFAQDEWKQLSTYPGLEVFTDLSISSSGTVVGMTADRSFYYSTDDGLNWQPFASSPLYYNATGIRISGSSNRVFVETGCCGLAMTDNFGGSWAETPFSTSSVSGFGETVMGIGKIDGSSNLVVTTFRVTPSAARKVYFSTNNGNSFQELPDSPLSKYVREVFFFGTDLMFVSFDNGGLAITGDIQQPLQEISVFQGLSVKAVVKSDNALFAAYNQNGQGSVVTSVDSGQAWTNLPPLPQGEEVTDAYWNTTTDELIVSTTEKTYKLTNGWVEADPTSADALLTNGTGTILLGGQRVAGIRLSDGILGNPTELANIASSNRPFDYKTITANNDILLANFNSKFVVQRPIASLADSVHDLYPHFVESGNIRSLQTDHLGNAWAAGLHHVSYMESQSPGFTLIADSTNAPLSPTSQTLYPQRLFNGNDGSIAMMQLPEHRVDYSSDQGQSWSVLFDTSLSVTNGDVIQINDVELGENIYYAGVFLFNGGAFFQALLTSTDQGDNWTSSIVTAPVSMSQLWIDHHDQLYASGLDNVYRWDTTSQQWTSLALPVSGLMTKQFTVHFDYQNQLYVNVLPANDQTDSAGIYRVHNQGYDYLGWPEVDGEPFRMDWVSFTSDNVPIAFSSLGVTGDTNAGIYYYSDSLLGPPPMPVDTTDTIIVNDTTTAIGTPGMHSIEVYPNPSSGSFHILNFEGSVLVYDLAQRLILEQKLEPGQEVQLPETLKPQALVLRLKDLDGRTTQRILIHK